ncbi:ABC transporter ATP-binding protein [Gemella sp. GH3]|uniref:ABC transporter ATP-binding protein n=1 Tax=unclassified Gemella TaxID=2624949 RepID=UPI0015D0CECC|nr:MULTISPECIES: ABC transporter ATP-binding protein [unclassified Gemella]MBF0714644.1 ABC transporter ATP-binding protein [Gemella sp. GH3.1]NYS51596.1 ABC transporter ATP-binding protein [Gemella sp. GH3]
MISLKNLKNLLDIAKNLKKPLIFATVFGSFGHLTVVIFTFLLAYIFTQSNINNLWLLIIPFLLAIFKGFFSYMEQLLNHYVAFKILHILRLKVMEKFKKLSAHNFIKTNSGDYMTLITSDIELLEVFYAHTITPFFINLIQTMVITLFVALFNVKLSIIIFILYLIIGIVVPLIFKNKGQYYGDNYQENLKNINNNSVDETYAIFETIQYNNKSNVNKKLDDETEQLIRASYQKSKFQLNITFLNLLLYNISILIFILSANKYLESKSLVISITAMYIVSFTPILYMGNIAATLSQTMAAGKRYLNLMTLPEQQNNDIDNIPFNKLTIKNLSFSYDNKKIINDFSFTAKKGEIIGIQGDSGSGKSTLAKIIMKLLPINNNCIFIDNIDINDINEQYFRENTSIIMQDSYLFNTTIKNNITLFEESIDKEALDYSLDRTNLAKFVESLPQKENTTISERSSNVSSGQKQRLSTARSLYSNSKILILDEATANIDIFNELELLNTLNNIKNDKIIFIISHNKSTLSICDRIINI